MSVGECPNFTRNIFLHLPKWHPGTLTVTSIFASAICWRDYYQSPLVRKADSSWHILIHSANIAMVTSNWKNASFSPFILSVTVRQWSLERYLQKSWEKCFENIWMKHVLNFLCSTSARKLFPYFSFTSSERILRLNWEDLGYFMLKSIGFFHILLFNTYKSISLVEFHLVFPCAYLTIIASSFL